MKREFERAEDAVEYLLDLFAEYDSNPDLSLEEINPVHIVRQLERIKTFTDNYKYDVETLRDLSDAFYEEILAMRHVDLDIVEIKMTRRGWEKLEWAAVYGRDS